MKPFCLLAIIEAYSITGPAKNLLEFAHLAKGRDVETVIATFTRSPEENLFTKTARGLGIQVEVIKESGPFDLAAMRALGQLADKLGPDVIQTHAVKSHFLARVSGLPGRAPWVAFHHGYTWPTLKARAYNQLDRWSLPAAEKVLTVSIPFRDELVAQGVPRARIEIVHNAIRPEWGSRAAGFQQEALEMRRRLNIPEGRKVVLIVGRLSREKDHLTLLGALAKMRTEADAQLVIVGEGPERPRIEARIAELGLTDRVTLTGQQSSAEPYYRIADLAVLSSLSEGSPNALLEAMAAGVPVVATAVGGIPEIVTDGESALLVKPGELTPLASAMSRVLNDERLAVALSTRSRALVLDRHTPDGRVKRLIQIYRDVADSARMRN